MVPKKAGSKPPASPGTKTILPRSDTRQRALISIDGPTKGWQRRRMAWIQTSIGSPLQPPKERIWPHCSFLVTLDPTQGRRGTPAYVVGPCEDETSPLQCSLDSWGLYPLSRAASSDAALGVGPAHRDELSSALRAGDAQPIVTIRVSRKGTEGPSYHHVVIVSISLGPSLGPQSRHGRRHGAGRSQFL
ncbi:uncharacterized protein BJ171DRAFT_57081 [Polychytrium aggregatum]|uniref:uncharacterized protein n=1 Tax=Polychytrium aggregatum TaxID=110093 RepID=UPI0022FEBDCB|nr:uncharacterized protein BJ171DRAFT_57081 [Polychytrium aggregatum]KAI9190762.1 hypothetical protein BJ171DRAFT_57081 [Polychytrium aggregatum]